MRLPRRLRRWLGRDGSRLVFARMHGNTAQDICAHGAVRSWSGLASAGGGLLPAIEPCDVCDAGTTPLRPAALTVDDMFDDLRRLGLSRREIERDRPRLQAAIDRLNGDA